MGRQTGMGEIFSISAPWDHQVTWPLHLPLEASGEARLVRKVGQGQDVMKERMLEMVGLPPLSINKEAAAMMNPAT